MKRIVSIALLLALLISQFVVASADTAEIPGCGYVYVATNGSDSNPGTFDKPLLTFHAARDKARQLKDSGNYPDGVIVYVRGGTYSFSERLDLTEKDSDVTWTNYGDEKVTITGGVSVNGKDFKKEEDKSILERVVDTSARDKIYMLDLKTYGITDMGEPYLPGAYSYGTEFAAAGLPNASRPSSPSSELLFNGESLTIARYPNTGYLNIDAVIDPGWDGDYPDARPVTDVFTIRVKDDRMKHWTNAPENSILMFGFWKFDWADQTVPLKSINAEKKELTSAHPSRFAVLPDKEFYVFNLIEELDRAGEYYLDYDNAVLYLIPPSDINKADIKLSLLETELVNMTNTKNILFDGIDATATRAAVFQINDGENNRINDSEISYTASRCINIEGGKENGVTNCYIHDVDGGITLEFGGDIKTLTPSNNYAINNHIERYSRISKTYVSAIRVGGVGAIAMHNEIHDAPHFAIDFSGQLSKIMYNNIYDVLQNTEDAGAIYGGLNWAGRGVQVKYNYIHDIHCNIDGAPLGVFGVYMDGGQCDMQVVGNVFENLSKNARGIQIGGGRDVVIMNNMFINCDSALWMVDVMTNVNLEQRHYPSLRSLDEKVDLANNEIWKETFPNLYKLMELPDSQKQLPEGNIFTNNLTLNTTLLTGVVAKNYSDVSKNYTISSSDGFVDFANKNFTLKEDSPIFTRHPEFKPLPFTRMGRIDNLADARIEDAVIIRLGSPYSLVDGTKKQIDDSLSVRPFAENGRTYVPLRFLAESLGASVDYNDGEITISSAEVNLKMRIDSLDATKNGTPITMENGVKVIDGRTLVPLREVSELLDKSVYWHELGFISVSDDPELFEEKGGSDDPIILNIYDRICEY